MCTTSVPIGVKYRRKVTAGRGTGVKSAECRVKNGTTPTPAISRKGAKTPQAGKPGTGIRWRQTNRRGGRGTGNGERAKSHGSWNLELGTAVAQRAVRNPWKRSWRLARRVGVCPPRQVALCCSVSPPYGGRRGHRRSPAPCPPCIHGGLKQRRPPCFHKLRCSVRGWHGHAVA